MTVLAGPWAQPQRSREPEKPGTPLSRAFAAACTARAAALRRPHWKPPHGSRLRQLDALTALLAGELPRNLDWMAALALANESLVTPQILVSAERSGALAAAPADVRGWLQEVTACNRARNIRLLAQLCETIAVLNAAGVEPILLKGAAYWALAGRPAVFDRMLTDLDLMVAPSEAPAAVRALEAAGFPVLRRSDDPDSHVVAELGRSHDVGSIDLHRRPPGPADLAQAGLAAAGQLDRLEWEGLRAWSPAPTLHVFLLALHDQFHDGGYWRGEFSLRHLLETAALSRAGLVDWELIAALTPTRLVRNAIDAQLHAAAELCGALAPATARRPWVRLQHARRLAQFAWPALSPLFVQGAA